MEIGCYSCIVLFESTSDSFDELLALGSGGLRGFLEELLVGLFLEIGELIIFQWTLINFSWIGIDRVMSDV